MLLTIQYLADFSEFEHLTPHAAAERLHIALDIAPFTHVLIGWNVPRAILEACRYVTEQAGAKFYRWQPLLTGDGNYIVKPEWQVIGLNGHRIVGYKNKPEFTFACPNHEEAAEENWEHLQDITQSKLYDGLFFDRIRFPSPAAHPIRDLGCFCRFCRATAANEGVDLTQVQASLLQMSAERHAKLALISALLGKWDGDIQVEEKATLQQLFNFRKQSISKFVKQATEIVKAANMEVGLDCFSPSLTLMVSQDFAELGTYTDWIKIMTYAHTRGPAGLPFELGNVLEYLIKSIGLSEAQALNLISEALQIPLPDNRQELQQNGISSKALAVEVERGVKATHAPVLAGIELVEIKGIAQLNHQQIELDLQAIWEVSPAGLAISWDLLHIPVKRLNLLQQKYKRWTQ